MSTLPRTASADDMARLAALEAEVTAYPWSERQYRDSLAARHGFTLLCEGDEILAWAVTLQVLDEVELLNIATALPHQGKGHAGELLQALMQAAHVAGARVMHLEVRESNAVARRLYQRSGFCQSGLRKHYYRSTAGREHAILMEKLL